MIRKSNSLLRKFFKLRPWAWRTLVLSMEKNRLLSLKGHRNFREACVFNSVSPVVIVANFQVNFTAVLTTKEVYLFTRG